MSTVRKHFALILVMLIIAFGSYYVGSARNTGEAFIPPKDGENSGLDFAPFWKVWGLIEEKYVPASTTAEIINNEEKVYGAIQGLADSLGDPYTVFLPPVESEIFEADIRGNFEGVGMEILAQNGAITVIAPLKESPAAMAGILAGDIVIGIDGKTTNGMTTEDAVNLIRGERNTAITLRIVREGVKEPFEIKIVRAVIDIPTISTKSLPGGIFVIELYSFSAQSSNLFRMALREFILSEEDKLLIDLRGNPGGYLESSIDMASWFLPSSAVVVREDFGGRKDERVYRSRGYDIFTETLPIVILIDEGSASASEILAGALQEHKRALLVGEKSFGKGSVQELIGVTDDTSLKITVARWLTPNGLSISEKGIIPDYKIERSPQNMADGKDPQLDKAVEILKNWQKIR